MTGQVLPPDRDLIEDIRSGDPEALARLQSLYWTRLVQFASRIVEGLADPQDVVQEAFIRLWTRRERWEAGGSLRALLYTLTRNAALDELRRYKRTERALHDVELPSTPPAPSDEAIASDLRDAAAAAVAALPPQRREVFRLAREEGLTYAEIAEVLGLSPQTVANHMSLALADLRRALERWLPERGPPL